MRKSEWIGAFFVLIILMIPFFMASYYGNYQFDRLADALDLLWETESPRAEMERGLLAVLLSMTSLSAIVAGLIVAIRFRKESK